MSIDYSVVIPAYNEVDWLPQTLIALEQAMALVPLKGEVIVCNNNSTDATADCAASLGAKVVFEPHNQISRARNCGAQSASGRYLIFLDADTLVSGALLQQALQQLESGQCCGGGSMVKFDRPINHVSRIGLNGWNWLSQKLGLAAGCFIFCTQQDFKEIGGFSEAVYASEELWFSRRLSRLGRQRGQYFKILSHAPVISSGRKFSWFNSTKQFGLLVSLLLFPFLVRYRRFCNFWYKRPEKS